jgi:hypothetical protein
VSAASKQASIHSMFVLLQMFCVFVAFARCAIPNPVSLLVQSDVFDTILTMCKA